MSNQGPAQEPTMEEILASIRRIISEDSGATEAPAAEYEPAPAAYSATPAQPAYDEDEQEDVAFEDDEVMELSEALPDEPEPIYEEPEPAPPVYQPAAAAPAPVYDEPEEIYEPEPEPEPLYEAEPEPAPEPVYEPEPVHQPQPAAASQYEEADYADSEGEIAFEEPVMSPNSQPSRLMSSETEQAAASSFGMLANSMLTSSGSGRTLEEVVGDQLKPMLKAWLDDNLPTLVERLVREEIERVSRRGR